MNFSSEADPSAIKTEPSTGKQIPNELQAFLQEQISPDNQKFQEIQAVVEKAERSPIYRESSPSGTFASSRRHTKFLDPGNRRLYSMQDIRERDPEFIVGRKASLMFQIRYDNIRNRDLFPRAKLIEESIHNFRPKDSRNERDNNMRNRNNDVKIVIHKDLETATTEPEEKQETLFDPQEFLMIKPITKEPISPLPDNLDPKKALALDQNLFSIELVNYASSLSDEDIKQNLRNLVELLSSNPDKNHIIDYRDPKQDIICSITLKPEDLSTLRDLLVCLLENLKEEPLSLKLKYKDEISCIETKFSKSTGSSIYNRASVSAVASKFREQEFEDLKASIETLIKEECFISSKEALAATHQFLLKIFEKFSQVHESGDYKSNEEIMIDYVTLPKLLERVLDPSETIFTERLIIYTYDLYLSSLNLMTYLIYNFFHLKPTDSSVIDLTDLDPSHQRSRVLDLIQFWLEERDEDFVLDPILSSLLEVFLDYYIQSEKENNENHLLYEAKIINSLLESILNRVPKPKNVTFLDPVNTHEESEIANGVKKLSEKNTSVATSPSISFPKEFLLCGLVGAVNKSSVHSNWKSLSPVKNVKGYLEEKNGLDCYLVIDRSPDDIARQLTLIDSKLFSQVNIREVIKMRWTKMDRHPCPAYLQYVSHFNDFSFWLQYTVLSLQSQYDQICLLKKFIDVALLCKYSYRNYSAPHYIYAALVSLENFGVISFQEHLTEEFEELRTIFAPEENYVRLYEIIFRNIDLPAVPSLIFFLKIFLKLQEGVTFKVKLPESKGDYLKFSTILQIQNYCSEMKRFQKTGYNRVIKKEKRLYNYLKNKFREEMPSDLESHETKMKTLVEMVNRSKQTRRSLLDYLFGFGRKKISI